MQQVKQLKRCRRVEEMEGWIRRSRQGDITSPLSLSPGYSDK